MTRPWMTLLWMVSVACSPGDPPYASSPSEDGPDTDGGGAGGAGDGSADSGGADDTGEPGPLDVQPGPDCRPDDWPFETPWNVLAAHVVAGRADAVMLEDLRGLVALLQSGEQSGPWDDEIKGPLASADGADFGDQRPDGVIDAASVPAVTVGPDGDVWVFFVDADLDGLLETAEAGTPMRSGILGVGGLGAARSSDGTNFERVDIAFEGDVPLYVVDPDIIPLPDGRYRMTYFGVPANQACADHLDPAASALPHSAYTAISDDLVTWTQEGIAWTPPDRGADPAVWCADASRCWMLMGGGAASTDGGRTYSPVEMNLPDPPLTAPDVFAVPGGWRMIYVSGTQLSTAVSEDGLTWTADGILPLSGADPTVLERDGSWWLYIKGKARTNGGADGRG